MERVTVQSIRRLRMLAAIGWLAAKSQITTAQKQLEAERPDQMSGNEATEPAEKAPGGEVPDHPVHLYHVYLPEQVGDQQDRDEDEGGLLEHQPWPLFFR